MLSGLACKMTPEERGGGRVEGGWVLEKLREERQTGRARQTDRRRTRDRQTDSDTETETNGQTDRD